MSSRLLEDGRYDAVINKTVLTESKNGNLMLIMELLIGGEVERRYWSSLTKDNGRQVNERQIQILRWIFPDWNGDDPSWLEIEDNVKGKEVLADIKNETNADGREWSNVNALHPADKPDAGSNYEMPPSIDKKTLQAKYGAKFRAFAGKTGKTVKPAKPAKPEPKKELPF